MIVEGKKFGFTSDIFNVGSYLWIHKKALWLSMIIVREGKRRQGYFTKFLLQAMAKYRIKVPTPTVAMKHIVEKHGFNRTVEWVEEMEEDVEVWYHKKHSAPEFCETQNCNNIAEWEGLGVYAQFGSPFHSKHCTKHKEAMEKHGNNGAIMEYNRFKPKFWKIGTPMHQYPCDLWLGERSCAECRQIADEIAGESKND